MTQLAIENYQRERLASPPLDLVICQVRFPVILELADGKPPVEFQKALTGQYPKAERQSKITLSVIGQDTPVKNLYFWTFRDSSKNWSLSLGEDFLALEVRTYSNFEEFAERLKLALNEALRIYQIKLRERIGLRFVNRINKQKCDYLPDNWQSLINKEVLPMSTLTGDTRKHFIKHESRINLESCYLTFRVGFSGNDFSSGADSNLALDFDCYSEENVDLEVDKDIKLLWEYKSKIYRSFRWATGALFDQFPKAKAD